MNDESTGSLNNEANRRGRPWVAVDEARWNDWHWQLRSRITELCELEQVVHLTEDERRACAVTSARFAWGATPYYASLMSADDPTCPIRRQIIPSLAELAVGSAELCDPLAEDTHAPVQGLTHRYPDRALLYVTHSCAAYCRHCNRKRKVGDPSSALNQSALDAGLGYIRAHPELRDILVSGGDPLTLSDERLEQLVRDLRAIPHVEIIRIATRAPVTLPQRITPALAAMLRRYHPIYVNTHFNHPKECTTEAAQALRTLADVGCVLGNQMVLLRGINDELETVRTLNRWLLTARCRPYYIFQADLVHGIGHFRTPLARGIALIDGLRGWMSGLGVPHFVVDLPGGGGKVPLGPEYMRARDGKHVVLRNYAGDEFDYDDI